MQKLNIKIIPQIQFIRSEKKFKSLEQLKKQIKIDVIKVKKNV